MITLGQILFLFSGLLAGAALAWLVLRGRMAVATTAQQVELKNREAALAQLQGDLRDKEDRIGQILRELQSESDRRSAAEAHNARIPVLEQAVAENARLQALVAQLRTELEKERKAAEEKLGLLNDAKEQLSNAFKALSAEALKTNNQSFLDLAKATLDRYQEGARTDLERRQQAIDALVKPVQESLAGVDKKIQAFDQDRKVAFATLSEQVKGLSLTQAQLQGETANLVKALRSPRVRGRWGEVQLHRVVEIAGMLNHVDFEEQITTTTGEGRQLRPDMKIKLPNGRIIVVDSKVPLEAYLEAMEAANDERRTEMLNKHAAQLRAHFDKLGEKEYAAQFPTSPEFVVLFLPGESFFSAALEQEPGLIEYGVSRNVILATPTTLIALLKAVAYGWNQEQIAQNARKISEAGQELHKRVKTLAEHIEKVGKGLNGAITAYDDMIGSLERSVLPQARRFREFDQGIKAEIPELKQIQRQPRAIAGELAPPGGQDVDD